MITKGRPFGRPFYFRNVETTNFEHNRVSFCLSIPYY